MEHVLAIFGLGALAGIVTGVADAAFHQSWGAPQFFMIWLFFLVVSYGGFIILDDDGDFW